KNSAPAELPLVPEKFVGSSHLTLPDYVVFENIVLVLTKRLRSAFNFLSHFFHMRPRVFCAKSARQYY
ncbi:hypothetical protein, partial [Klebsiella variicola]|uniref:hypothetical protein n=1 Tax=Klebsiella variicola TaxID=244366 RepID=UPI00214DD40E